MNPGGPSSQAYKICPVCQRRSELHSPQCVGCGHVFRQTFTPPPFQQTVNPTQAFYAQPGTPQAFPNTLHLSELARRFAESRKLCIWTFWLGVFCLWPAWIVTYLEFVKMRNIKEEVSRKGVDVMTWLNSYGLKDPL